jgi:hypothetical protein
MCVYTCIYYNYFILLIARIVELLREKKVLLANYNVNYFVFGFIWGSIICDFILAKIFLKIEFNI